MKYFLLLIASLLSFFGAGAKVFYVDAGATGANNGASWANAYKYLSDALTAAQASGTSDIIYIAQGTYYPTGAQSGANRDASFLIRQSGKLKIYGGFPTGGGVRNAAANPTILSGDIGISGTQTDNSYHVVVIAGLSAAADSVVLDGLRIQWGRASGSNNFAYNSQNIPRNKGGGIVAYGNANDNKLTIRNCIISGNYASDAGAGICNSATSPLLVNVLLSGNYADYGGGMINGSGSDARIINCTIAGNHDNNGGGGMRNSSSTPIIANTIIYGNKGGISNNSSAPVITYSLVQGLVGGTGNLGSATNPQFINPVASGTVNISGDYRLNLSSSIAINAGRNDSIPDGITTDLDGSVRRFHGDSVDVGAYEASGFNVFVDGTNGNDASDGRSWAAAFKTLSKAVYISQQIAGSLYQNVDSILVAKGTYYPTGAQNGTNRESTFLFLRGNLKVYGGYPTGGGVRNPATNPTIMSGNIGSAGSAADNSYHVVGIGNLTTDSLVIDGFQITGGNADGSGTVTVGDVVLDRGNGGGVSMITNGNNPKIAIRNCQITNNAAKFGGGMYCLVGSAPALLNCIISGNTAVNLGGGLYLSYSNASLKNVLVHSNSANSGSGIYCTTVTGDLINVTQANNSGNGFYAENGTVNWKNSIVWDAVSGNGYSMQYSLTKGVNSTANNNVADPGFAAKDLFINPAGNNFSLFQCSPVLNVGSNGFVSGTSTDISGNPRIYNNGAVDLGAYEYQGNGFAASNKIFVDGLNGNDNNSGTTWATAFKTLSYALVKTQSNEICYSTIDSILVAKGTYYPTGAQNGTNRDSTFLFKRGKLKVYGGYPNGGGTRNIAANPTILSGNIGNPADSTDNSYHVAVLVGVNTDSLVIDGFRIQNGTANVDAVYYYNGTSLNSRHGGGVGIVTNSSNPKIALRNCSFTRNYSGFWGGGLFVWYAILSLDNCVFYENVGGIGGGMYTSNAAVNLNRCTFSFNSASDGGGVATVYTSTLNITNCLFTNNTAAYINSSGGGLFNYLSDVNTYHTTFANNNGGSGYKESGVTYWNNSIVWDVISSNNYTTNNCLLKGKTSTANGNLSAAGLTAGSIFANPATNDFSLLPCSPAINAGSNALATGITTDISGNPRIYGSGTVDLGAYEYQALPVPFNKIYVDSANGNDENNGASWAYPFKTLSYALSKVHGSELCFSTVDSILVAKGTYYPTGAQNGTNRDSTFLISRGKLKLYGGYPSGGGGARNIAGNPTILSGDIGTANNSTDNSYHVMVVTGNITDSAVVDGFQIAYGMATNGSGTYSYTGFLIDRKYGGGIFVSPATSSAKIWLRNCLIRDNSAASGGGIFWTGVHPSGFNSCTITANTAAKGGGIYNLNSAISASNSILYGNTGTNSGGALYSFADNNSYQISFNNMTVVDNGSNGFYNYGYAYWRNSILWDDNSGSGILSSYSLRKGNNSTTSNNISATGLTAADIFANPAANDYKLRFCSPALNAGNNAYITGYTTDISGNSRIRNTTVDLGAYEKQSDLSNMATNAMLSAGSANATPLLRSCEENGWTWYADPSKADSLSFAIKWGTTNNNAKNAAGVFLHATSGNTLASNGTSQAIITMKRYWNVDLHGTTLTTPVSVRFLFNAADTSEMHATINSAVNSSGNKLVWFKTTGSLFNPNQVTFNDINGGNFIPLVPVYGIANGIPYVEFSGITSFSGGTAGVRAGGGAPLPVTLLSFTAQLTPDNQHALLSWQTTEENLKQYEIARSTNGAKSWNIVGALPAAGHEQYQFQDKLTGVTAHDNKVFYRLRLVENNGSFNYSKTSYVLLPAEKQPAITVSPNPFKETFTIRNPIPALNGKQTQITDDLGRLKEAFVLETTVSIDASQWIPGVYLIRFPNGEVVKVVRE